MIVLGLAVLLDLVLGEPPNRWHPVAWVGGLIAALQRLRTGESPRGLLIQGAALLAVVVTIAGGGGWLIDQALARGPEWLRVIVEAWLLKCAFSLRTLFLSVQRVRDHLMAADLGGARRQLSLHLVSRPTSDLDAGAVASGAVESLAENLTDSWVAPVLFFLVGGLAGAWAYRAVNTADAMIGYREGALLYLGRAAARVDDVLNLLPARLAGLSLVVGAWPAGQSVAGAWRIMRRDGRTTDSPNAGITMAAMAGAIGKSLEKRGHYRLGDGPAPDLDAMDRARRVGRWAAAIWLVVALAIVVLTSRAGGG